METPPGCFPRTQEKLDLRCWPPVLQTPLTKSRHFLLIGRPRVASNPRKMFVYGTRSAPSSLARRPTPPTTIRTITRQVAKLGSLRRRSERETARANYRSSQIIIGRPTDSPLDVDSHA